MNVVEITGKCVDVIKARLPDEKWHVWLFGSHAKDCATPGSDVDIAIEGHEYVDITLSSLLLSYARAEQAKPLNSVSAFYLRLGASNDVYYLSLSHKYSPVVSIGESIFYVKRISGYSVEFTIRKHRTIGQALPVETWCQRLRKNSLSEGRASSGSGRRPSEAMAESSFPGDIGRAMGTS